MQPFPHPSNASHKIWSRLANWLQRYSSLKVWMTTTTDDHDGRTTDHWYTISLWAFGSRELKKWKHHFPHYKSMGVFLRCSRAANSIVGGPIWLKFELIHNIMHVLVTSKFEKDRININRDYVMTSIFETLKGSQLRSQWWDLSEIQTHISFYVCPHYLQVWKGSDQKQPRKCNDFVFPIISLWEFFPTLKGS